LLHGAGGFNHLNVFIFSEEDVSRLIKEVLIPGINLYLDNGSGDRLYKIIGVDGEYGKHYSFLKAISAFWHVFIDPGIKGTFKIDLDQVFPQDELVSQTGASAFEHLETALWGAVGLDHEGRSMELGMIAGALVNSKDIHLSLFTPDVLMPTGEIIGDRLIFHSQVPQALSTEAEMMTRYNSKQLDGLNTCIQRIHVTGGTSGILVKSLRKFRPFTPTFIGRAEDQAYLMSVLFERPLNTMLRYVHKDGLIMRHDKEILAADVIRISHIGKLVGDYLRILNFSFFAQALPWPLKMIKAQMNPFTGCFISQLPFTVVYLRLALRAAELFASDNHVDIQNGCELLDTGSRRLHKFICQILEDPVFILKQFQEEKEAWMLYFDLLDRIEEALLKKDRRALQLKDKAESIVKDLQI
jgi:hypothetical protein